MTTFKIYVNLQTFPILTSLPGNRARVYIQAGKPSDLFFSESRGISLFYAQFLNKHSSI